MARQSRGELAAAQGRLDAALHDYAEAQAGYAAAGNEYEAARCLAAAAVLRFRRGTPDDLVTAQAMQTEARRIFERLGAT